jgi:hypothetical protein
VEMRGRSLIGGVALAASMVFAVAGPQAWTSSAAASTHREGVGHSDVRPIAEVYSLQGRPVVGRSNDWPTYWRSVRAGSVTRLDPGFAAQVVPFAAGGSPAAVAVYGDAHPPELVTPSATGRPVARQLAVGKRASEGSVLLASGNDVYFLQHGCGVGAIDASTGRTTSIAVPSSVGCVGDVLRFGRHLYVLSSQCSGSGRTRTCWSRVTDLTSGRTTTFGKDDTLLGAATAEDGGIYVALASMARSTVPIHVLELSTSSLQEIDIAQAGWDNGATESIELNPAPSTGVMLYVAWAAGRFGTTLNSRLWRVDGARARAGAGLVDVGLYTSAIGSTEYFYGGPAAGNSVTALLSDGALIENFPGLTAPKGSDILAVVG